MRVPRDMSSVESERMNTIAKTGRAPRAPSRLRPARAADPRLALLILFVGLLACRKTPKEAPDAGTFTLTVAPPPTGNDFSMADLVAATQLDARLQRLLALSSEYKVALTFDRGSQLIEHTDRLAKLLDEGAAALDSSLQAIRDPRDRSLAAPLVATARRWPALLRDARAELLGPPNIHAAQAAQALSAADDDVSRALEAYRGFRAAWSISDSPDETRAVVDFLLARRALEVAEAELGRRLHRGPGKVDAGASDEPGARQALDRLVTTAREAAGRVDESRRPSSQRWVQGQARALGALVALAGPDGVPEDRARRSLEYQMAKLEALEAVADYTRLTMRRSSASQ